MNIFIEVFGKKLISARIIGCYVIYYLNSHSINQICRIKFRIDAVARNAFFDLVIMLNEYYSSPTTNVLIDQSVYMKLTIFYSYDLIPVKNLYSLLLTDEKIILSINFLRDELERDGIQVM